MTHSVKFNKIEIIKKIRKREMFLMKYAISVKREEMRKLEKLAREEEQKLLIAEQAKLTITNLINRKT